MTGKELAEKIIELGAEEMEVVCINYDGLFHHAECIDVAEDVALGERKLVIT